ncbi:Rieske 2Fe-2S domain-containing protein [Pseudomaricurvus alkylphenolicus]|uniref:Rieske 2Fe-2S domain-containing protein n=1 Tax=Pseudomaricurvus alkylphenolicus TaxID=1306991 RepID=UPI0014237146|nr:Rieske 2Fe-2S domain-containing protein [Pseudomaricurvus alkylphenolicus]
MQADVLALEELGVGDQRCVAVSSLRLLICRTDSGVYAIENRCPHANLPLQGGVVVSDVIRCPSHGAKFRLQDGQPAIGRLAPVKTFPVSVVEGRILVDVA